MEFIRLDPDDYPVEPSTDGDPPSEWVAAHREPPPPRQPRTRGTASSVLMAAMLGLVDALGWERPRDETVEVADAPIGDDGFKLDYKHLEPLDRFDH